MQSERETVCRNILWLLVAQLAFLALWSLIAQSGPVFVQHIVFGWDFRDFYLAATDWLHRTNPYLLTRFDKPPLVLIVGTFFSWLPYGIAVLTFFALNLAIIVASVRACARKLNLPHQCTNDLTWIALLYYPVYFLIERGNLEGLVLGCFCWAFCTKNRYVRPVLVALAAGLKLYPLLLLAPAIRNRKWRFTLTLLLAFVLLLLPFYRLANPFLHAMATRGAQYEPYHQQMENISPAGILIVIAGHQVGKWIFLVFWIATLALMLYRQKQSSEDRIILPFLAWMAAFPLWVFPYVGVLLLPVLAWKLGEMKDQKPDLWDKLFVAGFLLVGVQATALSVYFQREPPAAFHGPPPAHPIFHWMNSLGMLLILASLAFQKARSNPAIQLIEDRGTAESIQLGRMVARTITVRTDE
jgi:hypothetical protein